MKGAHAISTRRAYGVQRVCRVWHCARSSVYARRQATVFDRMRSRRLFFVGPPAPGGRGADPWPDKLLRTRHNVPTYRTNHPTPPGSSTSCSPPPTWRGSVGSAR